MQENKTTYTNSCITHFDVYVFVLWSNFQLKATTFQWQYWYLQHGYGYAKQEQGPTQEAISMFLSYVIQFSSHWKKFVKISNSLHEFSIFDLYRGHLVETI